MTEEKYEDMKVALTNNLKEVKPLLEAEGNSREQIANFILSHFIQFAQKEIKIKQEELKRSQNERNSRKIN